MQELDVVVKQKLGKIECNLDEIKEALSVQMEAYKELELSEESIKERKADLATLRKIRTAVDDKRKAIKKEFFKPYEDFEAKVKDVLAVIDEPIELIDGKLKEFDAARAEEKKVHVKELYETNIDDLASFLPFEKVFNKKWLNVSTKDRDIIYDISEAKTKVRSALDVIKSLNSEIEDELIELYRNNDNDLALAIKRNTDYMADKAKVLAEQKEEVKPQAESMGKLNEIVEAFKTVKFVVSVTDREEVEMILGFNGIKYQVLEG